MSTAITEKTTIVRRGSVFAMACKTHVRPERWLVRQHDASIDNLIEIYNHNICRWVDCPAEWVDMIVWE